MATNRSQHNFYTNPAFCQKSEFYGGSTVQIVTRQSPVGAQTPVRYVDTFQQDGGACAEQEFYEEVLVDGAGVVKEKKILVVSSQAESPQKVQRGRYEYIPMREHYYVVPPSGATQPQNSRFHRYAVVEAAGEGNYAPMRNHRYEYIDEGGSPPKPNRYEYPASPPPSSPRRHRYDYIAPKSPQDSRLATQKLHEILSTPKKSPPKRQMRSPQPPRRPVPSSPTARDPFITPKSSPQKQQQQQQQQQKPRTQQKLNYTIATRQLIQDKRQNTAIVAPICSSPIQSVYGDTTTSKAESWMNLSINRPPIQATLAVAAIMMVLCGTVTTVLCFYMVSIMGRLYFLDFGTIAGFTCFVLGMLGFRTRNIYWLPNRNYISGYIVLSVFSLLTCAGLLVLLVLQPRPGTPLADMTSGAVCGISVLSLILATAGVVSSYCCKYPPPDNRVQHCVQGFTV